VKNATKPQGGFFLTHTVYSHRGSAPRPRWGTLSPRPCAQTTLKPWLGYDVVQISDIFLRRLFNLDDTWYTHLSWCRWPRLRWQWGSSRLCLPRAPVLGFSAGDVAGHRGRLKTTQVASSHAVVVDGCRWSRARMTRRRACLCFQVPSRFATVQPQLTIHTSPSFTSSYG